MKVKVSDYIAQLLYERGITEVFTVTGGGAMHLNNSLGTHKGLHCVYNHHEQACAIAAEGYARIEKRPAAVCVTTGPGGTNALTGVLGAYLDSIPMIVISGQVRYDTTARSTNLPLRAMGDQEFDITKAAASMTKYAQMVTEPLDIRFCLEKAIAIATEGRKGPTWLDIPLNVQGAYVETDDLKGYDNTYCAPRVTKDIAREIAKRVRNAKRPVLYAGSAIRYANAHEVFLRVAKKLNIPVVTTWNSIDVLPTDHPLYVGRGGGMGDYAGNYAVQGSDLVLAVGTRLSIRQVGFNFAAWAKDAYVIMSDIDENELKKPSLHVDMPIVSDTRDLLEALDREIEGTLWQNDEWSARCREWKETCRVVTKAHYRKQSAANVYAFIQELSNRLGDDAITVVGNGSACVVGSAAYVIKEKSRFIINSAVAAMGYDLPAAIGAAVASGREIVLVTGDGSIQMNLQELQTIIHHRFPIRIFVINNGGYHSIRQTQKGFFGEPLCGVGIDSGDLSFPDMEKIAYAYGYDYMRVKSNDDFSVLDSALSAPAPLICEVFVTLEQRFSPKSTTKKLPDGSLCSAPLDELS